MIKTALITRKTWGWDFTGQKLHLIGSLPR